MAVTSFDGIRGLDTEVQGKSFARRLLDRYIAAQMEKAKIRVNAYLQNLDDRSLRDMGYTPTDIKLIRQSDATIPLIV